MKIQALQNPILKAGINNILLYHFYFNLNFQAFTKHFLQNSEILLQLKGQCSADRARRRPIAL